MRARLKMLNATDNRPYALETSVGVAEHSSNECLETLLARADEAMYADKRARREGSGRDCSR